MRQGVQRDESSFLFPVAICGSAWPRDAMSSLLLPASFLPASGPPRGRRELAGRWTCTQRQEKMFPSGLRHTLMVSFLESVHVAHVLRWDDSGRSTRIERPASLACQPPGHAAPHLPSPPRGQSQHFGIADAPGLRWPSSHDTAVAHHPLFIQDAASGFRGDVQLTGSPRER